MYLNFMVVYYYGKVFKVKGIFSIMKKEIKMYECKCERCGHAWITRTEEVPVVCPKCKSPYWDKPLTTGKK